MEKMTRENIENIANKILEESDIIAKHGTTIANAQSILENGFLYYRTSFVLQKSKSAEGLCDYGWKDTAAPDDTATVIISIKKEFIKDWFGLNDEEYEKWIQAHENDKKTYIDAFSGCFNIAKTPKELIAGVFVWCDGKTYLNLEKDESALDHMTFIENKKFYNNLSVEEKLKFIKELPDKINDFQEEIQNDPKKYNQMMFKQYKEPISPHELDKKKVDEFLKR